MPGGRALGQLGPGLIGQRNRQLHRFVASAFPVRTAAPVAPLPIVVRGGKELGEVSLHREARLERSKGSIGRDLGGVEVQLLPPHQSRRKALLHDRLEEAAEDV
jgi:hypothetical protein